VPQVIGYAVLQLTPAYNRFERCTESAAEVPLQLHSTGASVGAFILTSFSVVVNTLAAILMVLNLG
jgi:hypothetical protein